METTRALFSSPEARGGLSAQEANALSLRNQTESPLLRLPAELRNRIFKDAFSGFTIVCMKGGERNRAFEGDLEFDDIYREDNSIPLATFLRKTTLCRQIRAETALLPFLNSSIEVAFPSMRTHSPGSPKRPSTFYDMAPAQQDAIVEARLSRVQFHPWWVNGITKSGILGLKNLRRVVVVMMNAHHTSDGVVQTYLRRIAKMFFDVYGDEVEVAFETFDRLDNTISDRVVGVSY